MTDDKPPPGDRPVPGDEPAPRSGERQPWDRRAEDRPPTLGDAGMPSAGRPPATEAPESVLPVPAAEPAVESSPQPANEAVEAGDEPTAVSRPFDPGDEPTAVVTPPGVAGDESTAVVEPPVAAGDEKVTPVAAGDEPTVADADRRSFDGGSTMRLQPPFFAPGTTRTPRATPPAEGPPLLDDAVESREQWESSPAVPERWPDTPAWPAGDETVGNDSGAERDTPERWKDSFARAATAADERAAADAAVTDEAAADQAEAGKAVADRVPANEPVPPAAAGDGDRADGVPAKTPPARRLTSAGALIWVLLALLGFTLVVQLQSNDDDAGLATARQEDLVGILSDLEARDQRLQQEINALEESQRQLTSGVAGRQAALAEAGKRADELGLLSGTLPARGPGLKILIDPKGQPIKASAILNAVQELRGAGGEVMEIIGDNGVAVRIVASSYFVDADGGQVLVDGKQLSGPYTMWVIGVPSTMQTALQIPGGVVASVSQAGGNVTMEQRSTVEVAAVRQPTSLQYARPVS